MTFLVLYNFSITHSMLIHLPLADFKVHTQPRIEERVLALHIDDSIEGARTKESRARTGHDINAAHIKIAGPKKVSQREVQAGRLVVYPINQLQRTYR